MMPDRMKALLARAKLELGAAGLVSLVLLGVATAFLVLVVGPLQERSRALDARLLQAERRSPQPAGARPSGAAAKLAAFYAFFDAGEPTEWLARLHQIAARSGLELRSADYRMQRTAGRLERYEITVPVNATYPQLRAFLRTALAEIPMLSLDQVAIKRQRAGDGQVQAEVRLTLHMVKS